MEPPSYQQIFWQGHVPAVALGTAILMPRKIDEFETDDEWSFISPGAKASESSDAGASLASFEQLYKVSDGKRKQSLSSGGSERRSPSKWQEASKGSPRRGTYTHWPNEGGGGGGRLDEAGSYGSSIDDSEFSSTAGDSRSQQLQQQQQRQRNGWWSEQTTRQSQQLRRQQEAEVGGGGSSCSSLGASGAPAKQSRPASGALAASRRGSTHVREPIRVAEGGRAFFDPAAAGSYGDDRDGDDGPDGDDVDRSADEDLDEALEAWLDEGESHGFVRVYSPPGQEVNTFGRGGGGDGSEATLLSRLVPCTTSAEAHEICRVAGLQPSSLHVQLNGDVIRRLDPHERPLAMQNEYLARIGYVDPTRVQREGLSTDLGYLIRFYSGKSFDDSTYARRQLSSVIEVKAGGILQRWSRRLCTMVGTKLTIHKGTDRSKESETLQLAKGTVEEVKMKGREYCIKITTSCSPQKTIFLSLEKQSEHSRWLKKARKATAKLPSSADLSGCNLEFLPETVFTNDQLLSLNLRHNALRTMPTEENIYTIGWLDDISRFKHLRSLNLADNRLDFFPPSVCDIVSLVELNLATNRIASVPAAISQLTSLQALHLHNNHLSTLPPEITLLKKLTVLVLAFNKFRSIPASVAMLTDVRVSECDTLVMAGNSVDSIPGEVIAKLKHVKRIDLRLNNLVLPLSETVRFNQLEHLTHLDIRDNRAVDLDLRYAKTLEHLNCERNGTKVLQLHGGKLKTITASRNEILQVVINPKPEWLESMDFSRNRLEKLPDWLPECYFLTKLNVCYNRLASLPTKIFSESPKLKILQADHNRIKTLPLEVGSSVLEEVYLQANQLQELPPTFLSKTNRLRLLNLSGNQLTHLPSANSTQDLNKLQELYLTSNNLRDDCLSVIAHYTRLKVLHLSHNALRAISDECISSLEWMQELSLSANHLDELPQSLGKLEHMKVLRAHSNKLTRLPNLDTCKGISVLDVSCNPLQNVSAADLLNIGHIQTLDISSGNAMNGNSWDTNCRGCFRRSKELLYDEKPRIGECELAHACEVGTAESHGSKNNACSQSTGLCVASLAEMQLYERNEAVFGIVDGGKNDEVARTLKNSLPHILNEELVAREGGDGSHVRDREFNDLDYLKYTFLTAHKKLKQNAQHLGASVLLCHVLQYAGSEGGRFRYRVNVANVGDVRAVLSRRGEVVQLSRTHLVPDDRDECRRISQNDGIITEEGKVNGISHLSRCIGNSYLYPQVIPIPSLASEKLRMSDDESLIIANGAFWRCVTYGEAVQMASRSSSAVGAAKSLQDLAQAYGCVENLCIVVIRFGPRNPPSCSEHTLPDDSSRQGSEISLENGHSAKMLIGDPLAPEQQHVEENYVNVENLRQSGHIPSPWDSKLSRRPMPTPRTSLVKVYSSAALQNDDRDDNDDYCELSRLKTQAGMPNAAAGRSAVAERSASTQPGRPQQQVRASPTAWTASMVRDWQFRSDGYLLNAAMAADSTSALSPPSSSSESGSSTSSTLTVSTERSGSDDDSNAVANGYGSRVTNHADGVDGRDRRRATPQQASGVSVERLSSVAVQAANRRADSSTRHRGGREAKARSGQQLGGENARLRRRRLCNSDTKLQNPAAIELPGSPNYFNRPALVSSAESFVPEEDEEASNGYDEENYDETDRQEEGSLIYDSLSSEASLSAGRISYGSSTSTTSNGDADARQVAHPVASTERATPGFIAAGSTTRSSRHGIHTVDGNAESLDEYARGIKQPQPQNDGWVGSRDAGSAVRQTDQRLAAAVYLNVPQMRAAVVSGTEGNNRLLSDADIRALQTYSDETLLSYKDIRRGAKPAGARAAESGSAGDGDRLEPRARPGEAAVAPAVAPAPVAKKTMDNTSARFVAPPPTYSTGSRQRLPATASSPGFLGSVSAVTNAAVADDATKYARQRAAAVASAAAAVVAARAQASGEARDAAEASQRLHPGVHRIEYYKEQQPSRGQQTRENSGGPANSSAYGSLTWSSSTVGRYDTYL